MVASPSHAVLLVCVAVAGILVEANAARSYVGAEYLKGYGMLTKSLSCYTAGITPALSPGVTVGPVTYTASIVPVQSGSGYDTLTSFSTKANYMAMFGPSGRVILSEISKEIDDCLFVNFAPFVQAQSQNPSLCRYQDQVYWTLPMTQAQVVGLLYYLSLRDLYPLQQVSVRTINLAVGESAQKMMVVVAPALGVKMTLNAPKDDIVEFVSAHKVRVVYQNTEADNDAGDICAALLASPTLIKLNASLATTVELAYITLQKYKSEAGKNKVLPPENIIISMPVPGLEATQYVASQEFAQKGTGYFDSLSMLQKNLMMAGWVSGRALMSALNKYTGTVLNKKRIFYRNLLAAQSSFLIDELFIGSFGPSECPSSAANKQGALCNCHAGGNNIWFHSFAKSGATFDTTPLSGGLFQYGLGMCANLRAENDATYTSPNTAVEILDMPRTVHLVGLSPSNDAMVSDLCSQAHSTINRLANTTLYWHHSKHAVRGYCQKTTLSSVSADLATHIKSYVTTSLMGVIPDGILTAAKQPSSLILDFMPQTTQPRIPMANYVYLFPTLEQELTMLASYLTGVVTDESAVCGVVRSSSTSVATVSLVEESMSVFGMSVPPDHLQQPTSNLGANIPAGCTHTVVIGIAKSDAAGLLAYLKSHPNNVVLVSFDDVTKFYSSIYSAFHAEDASVTGRLVFATNLPGWTGPTLSATERGNAKALSTVPDFVQTLSPTEQTPAAVRSFIVAMLYDQLTMGTRWGQSDLSAALYGNVTVHVGGMAFGPFTRTWSGASHKLVNYGAKDIAVWSFTHVTDASTDLLAPPRTPSLGIGVVVASRVRSAKETSKPLLAVGQDGEVAGAKDKVECVELQASSSNPREEPTLPEEPQGSPPPAGLNISSDSVTDSISSSSSMSSLWTVVYVLAFLLVLVLLYIIVLLLLWCGTVSWVAATVSSMCCTSPAGKSLCETAAAKLRTHIDAEGREDRELQHMARDRCRAPDDLSESLTFVFVEVELWRVLWVRQGEVMARAVRHFNRCVRLAVVELQCYEAESVEGMFLVVCPSASTGLQFARAVVEKVAGLKKSDADVLSSEYKLFGSNHGPACGLRLRVAVHTGTAIREADVSGRVKLSGTTVTGVITSAYIAGAAGMVVLTRSAARTIESANGEIGALQSVGIHSLTRDTEEELLRLEVLSSNATAWEGAGNFDVDSAVALHMLGEAGNYAKDNRACELCAAVLDEHYTGICEDKRVADLRLIGQRCGLLDLLPGMFTGHHGYYKAVQVSVCRHLAALLECRHGVPRTGRVKTHAPIINTTRGPSQQWSNRESAQAARISLRKSLRKRGVFFAYSRCDDERLLSISRQYASTPTHVVAPVLPRNVDGSSVHVE